MSREGEGRASTGSTTTAGCVAEHSTASCHAAMVLKLLWCYSLGPLAEPRPAQTWSLWSVVPITASYYHTHFLFGSLRRSHHPYAGLLVHDR